MSRMVIVHEHETPDGPPVEVGRAWLGIDGVAIVRGFQDVVRKQYESEGVFLRQDPETAEDIMVPLSDGDKFLDVLKWEYRGSRVIAQEVDVP